MIISFGWTTPALLAGVKTVTRRDWNDKHAQQWIDRIGTIADAWNASPRVVSKQPHPIAKIRIESVLLTAQYPDEDFELEGLRWLDEHGIWMPDTTRKDFRIKPAAFWNQWRAERPMLYRVAFEVVEYLECPRA